VDVYIASGAALGHLLHGQFFTAAVRASQPSQPQLRWRRGCMENNTAAVELIIAQQPHGPSSTEVPT
jgi:hypothetical protein